ncbi:MAG: hypothetical protein JWM71_2387 [Solirubrobacteraceae bacterium]|nr:hypothetical protein [Solirubrobacteraceae bacterium]
MRVAAGALAILALTPATAAAVTLRHVSPGGIDSGPCTAAAPCSVAWGINGGGSRRGDTIALAGGTYVDQPIDVTRELFLRGPARGPRPVLRTTTSDDSPLVLERDANGSTVTHIAVQTTASGAQPIDVRTAATLTDLTVSTTDGPCLRIAAPGARLDDSTLTQGAASPDPCLSSTQSDTAWTGVRVRAPLSDNAALFSGDGVIDGGTFVAQGTALLLGGTPTVRRVTATGGSYGILLGGTTGLITDSVAVAGAGGSAVYATGGNNVLLNVTAWATAPGGVAVRAVNAAALQIQSTIAKGDAGDIAAEPAEDAGTGSCAGPDSCPAASVAADHSIFRRSARVANRGSNIARPPRLVDPGHGNFRPAKGSPAIDHGIYELQSGTADRAGLFRWLGREPDIGAYETRPLPHNRPKPPDTTPPVLSNVRLGAPVFRPAHHGVGFAAAVQVASLLHFTLSEKADVVGIYSRPRAGAPALGAFVVTESFGAHRLKLSGRLNGHPLRPGTYRLTLIARDEAQNLSPETHLLFTIVR